MCDAECESVSHVLWDCPAYSSAFMLELRRELGEKTLCFGYGRKGRLGYMANTPGELRGVAGGDGELGCLCVNKSFV